MERFFQVIKELLAGENGRTAVGIDGELAGQKAVLVENLRQKAAHAGNGELTGQNMPHPKAAVRYRTKGFPETVLKRLLAEPQPGLWETGHGRVFVEALGTGKKLILCGGGHVSLATLAIAKLLEFHITVLEDRSDFAQAALKAGADHVICDDFSHGLLGLRTDRDTFVVIMTRGHRYDLDCLREMFQKEYAYLGMMGSRSRVQKIREQLKKEGISEERLKGLHAPVGLSIGAMTPAEIGVSILAEVIEEKNRNKRQPAYEKEVADWLFSKEEQRAAVLATIVARKGSAPRQIGTKMLIFSDGSSLGTIGGGCMEAEVKNKARHMLAAGQERYKTCFVDMTGQEAEEEGMVCGGTLEIFLEIL